MTTPATKNPPPPHPRGPRRAGKFGEDDSDDQIAITSSVQQQQHVHDPASLSGSSSGGRARTWEDKMERLQHQVGGDDPSKTSEQRTSRGGTFHPKGDQQALDRGPPQEKVTLRLWDEEGEEHEARPGVVAVAGSMNTTTTAEPTTILASEEGEPVVAEVANDDKIRQEVLGEILQGAAHAEIVEDNDGDNKGQRSRWLWLLVLLVVVLGIALGVSIPLALRKEKESTPMPSTSMSPSTVPTMAPSPSPTGIVMMTILLQLDEKPSETGWRLDCEPNPIFVPPGNYNDPGARIVIPVPVGLGQECDFTLLDTGNDGLGEAGFLELYAGEIGETTDTTNLTPFLTGGGDFGGSLRQTMSTDRISTDAPTTSPAPSISAAPTPIPPVPVTIVIQLEDFPDETAWSLVCNDIIYADIPFRTYDFVDEVVEDTFLVQDGSFCNFTIQDADSWRSSPMYSIYIGTSQQSGDLVAEGNLLGEDDTQGLPSATVLFLADGEVVEQTLEPTTSPAPTATPGPSASPTRTVWDLYGDIIEDVHGDPCVLSEDGSVVAFQDFDGVKVMRYDPAVGGGTWRQLGQALFINPADTNGERIVTLSGDGKTVALAETRDAAGDVDLPGFTAVFQLDETSKTWTRLGSILDGPRDQDEILTPISLSYDGSIFASGEREYPDPNTGARIGRVRVFQYSVSISDWEQIGRDILGYEDDAWFGNSVSLSKNGTIVAAGTPFLSNARGSASCFRFNAVSGEWDSFGQELPGRLESIESGTSVSLSGDGVTLAVGTYFGAFATVYRYDFAQTQWIQLGQDLLEPEVNEGYVYGVSVSLSDTGDILVVGNPYGLFTKVFRFSSAVNDWIQIGDDIPAGGLSVSVSGDGRAVAIGDGNVTIVRRN